jgi:hypothetical protein
MHVRLVATLLLLSLVGLGAADPAPIRITGIYSNLSFHEETGDLVGMELLVLPGPGEPPHWRALFQLAEGGEPTALLVELRNASTEPTDRRCSTATSLKRSARSVA